jgi:hypothetical protein
MSRGPSTFKERDLTRAVRAVVRAGLEVARVDIDRIGQIRIVIADGDREVAAENPWDRALAEINRGS